MRIGTGLHERFVGYREQHALITPEASARVLARHLQGSESGRIWTSADAV